MPLTTEVLRFDPKDGIPRVPCAVCGRKSSGFHYGADTCGACKVRKGTEQQIVVADPGIPQRG